MTELNDKELFESAISDAPVETAEAVEAPEVETGPVRDEMGRFAPREQAEQQPIQQPPVEQAKPDEAHVPSWRLREVNEAKEAAERRAQEAAERIAQYERQLAEVQRQIQQQQRPAEPLDPWSDLPAFVNQGVRQEIDPVRSEIQSMREYYSRKDAIRTHGEEKVKAAYDALASGINTRDPEAMTTYQRAMQSADPFDVIVGWHQRTSLVKETGGDLSAYRNKVLEEALKDSAFLAKAVEAVKSQTTQSGRPNIVQLPPSLNRATSAASPHEEAGDLSDRSLYAYATR